MTRPASRLPARHPPQPSAPLSIVAGRGNIRAATSTPSAMPARRPRSAPGATAASFRPPFHPSSPPASPPAAAPLPPHPRRCRKGPLAGKFDPLRGRAPPHDASAGGRGWRPCPRRSAPTCRAPPSGSARSPACGSRRRSTRGRDRSSDRCRRCHRTTGTAGLAERRTRPRPPVVGLDKEREDVREGKRAVRGVIAEQRGLGVVAPGPSPFPAHPGGTASTRSARSPLPGPGPRPGSSYTSARGVAFNPRSKAGRLTPSALRVVNFWQADPVNFSQASGAGIVVGAIPGGRDDAAVRRPALRGAGDHVVVRRDRGLTTSCGAVLQN